MRRVFMMIVSTGLFWLSFSQDTLNNKSFSSSDKKYLLSKAGEAINKDLPLKGFSPFGGSLSNFISSFSLTASFKKETNGKIELKYYDRKKFVTIGLSADQAIGKNDKKAIPVDLHGISSGTTGMLNIQKMFWSPDLSNHEFDRVQQIKMKYALKKKIDDTRTIMLSEIQSDTSENEKYEIKLKQPWFLNASFSVNKNDLSYVRDSFLLEEIETTLISPKAAVSIIKPFYSYCKLVGHLSFNYVYSKDYSLGNDLTLLVPFGTTGNLLSKSVAFGVPQAKYDHRVGVEWRRLFEISKENLGIMPSATYGINSKKIAFSFPVYFVKSAPDGTKPQGLQGGIELRYATDVDKGPWADFKHGLGAQLVITEPFKLF